MSITIDGFLALVDGLITASNTELAKMERYRLIRAAIGEYSVDRPYQYTEDVTGNDGRYYEIVGASPVLSRWVDGFSRVLAVEYPAISVVANETPTYLDGDFWNDDYWYNEERFLFFPNHSPASTESLRVRYTTVHTWTASAVTIEVLQVAHGFVANDYLYFDSEWRPALDPNLATHQVTEVDDADNFTAAILQTNTPASDFQAICALAASKCCLSIATRYARTNDTIITADSVDHRSRAGEMSFRYKDFLNQYREHMGLNTKDKPVQAAGVLVDLDAPPTLTQGSRYLFHRRGR